MSDVTTAEQIAWQRRSAILLGRLLELAARESLPPIAWTVQTAGAALAGQVRTYPASECRAHFGAWKSAIAAASGQHPDHDSEHESGGTTRLLAGWERMPVTLAGRALPPRVHVTLSAAISAPYDPEEGSDA